MGAISRLLQLVFLRLALVACIPVAPYTHKRWTFLHGLRILSLAFAGSMVRSEFRWRRRILFSSNTLTSFWRRSLSCISSVARFSLILNCTSLHRTSNHFANFFFSCRPREDVWLVAIQTTGAHDKGWWIFSYTRHKSFWSRLCTIVVVILTNALRSRVKCSSTQFWSIFTLWNHLLVLLRNFFDQGMRFKVIGQNTVWWGSVCFCSRGYFVLTNKSHLALIYYLSLSISSILVLLLFSVMAASTLTGSVISFAQSKKLTTRLLHISGYLPGINDFCWPGSVTLAVSIATFITLS